MFSLLKESGDRRTLRKSQEKRLSVFVPCSCFRLKVIEYQGILLVRDMKSEAGMKVEVQILEFVNP